MNIDMKKMPDGRAMLNIDGVITYHKSTAKAIKAIVEAEKNAWWLHADIAKKAYEDTFGRRGLEAADEHQD